MNQIILLYVLYISVSWSEPDNIYILYISVSWSEPENIYVLYISVSWSELENNNYIIIIVRKKGECNLNLKSKVRSVPVHTERTHKKGSTISVLAIVKV